MTFPFWRVGPELASWTRHHFRILFNTSDPACWTEIDGCTSSQATRAPGRALYWLPHSGSCPSLLGSLGGTGGLRKLLGLHLEIHLNRDAVQ